jgi:DUF4097 and DUF4098 domain-containing protein YvlB
MRRATLFALVLPLALAFSAAQAHEDTDGDISKVNGSITAEAGQKYGDLETVNGHISVNSHATAEDVETVNGGIDLEDDAQVRSATTVNGSIDGGQRVHVDDGLETVNGGVELNFNSRVGKDIETVNGTITIKQSEVGGQLHTVQGDITIGAKSVVHGGVLIEKPHGLHFGHNRIPRVVIGPNATVQGTLRFEREVELFVHPSAHIGTVVGATAQSWTDKLPPRRED